MSNVTGTNGTDCFFYFNRGRTEGFAVYSMVYFAIVLTVVVLSGMLWFKQRNTFHLKQRHGRLVSISLLGLCISLITGPMSRFLGSDLPCVLDIMTYYLSLPVIIWPIVVRLYLWVNKVKFNYKLAQKLAEGGFDELNTSNKSLLIYRIRASERWGLFVAIVPLIIYGGATYVLVEDACRQCTDFFSFGFVLFLIAVAIGILLTAGGLYLNRNVPDPTGLRRDTRLAATWAVLLGVPGLIMQQADVLGFSTQNPQPFDFAVLIDFCFLTFMFFIMFYPVRKSFATVQDQEPSALNELLNNERGLKFFELYLATELSLENLLFYRSAQRWKKNYQPGSAETIDGATLILDLYLKNGSDLEINIAYTIKADAQKAIREGKLSANVLDDCIEDVTKLMANHSYDSFVASDFYKLYAGDIEPSKATWITSSGYSSYAFISRDSLSGASLLM